MNFLYDQNQMFNQQFVNPAYIQDLQARLHHQEQTQEIAKAVKAIKDYCEAIKKITPDYREQAFCACATVVLEELGQ